MANELKKTYASPVTVSSSSIQIAAAALNATTAIQTNLTSANHSNYPYGKAVLSFSNTASISSASATINLYRRDLDVSGTDDTPDLSTVAASLYLQRHVGTFVAKATNTLNSTGQDLVVENVPLSENCEFHIENRMNCPVGAGWTLVITPYTYVPGA